MSTNNAARITQLLCESQEAGEARFEELFPLVYDDLRQIAARYLRNEREGHTLQPTALVNEAFCRLTGADDLSAQSRSHFFALAATAMRRILVDHARRRHAKKRGGSSPKLSLDQLPEAAEERDPLLLALDDGLEELAARDPRQAKMVELRFFAGLTIEQTAQALECSHATVERDWTVAKAWLSRYLRERFGDE